eukprot:gnl/TRDRNA2_/TRDRNA2_193035_c0_seq1.p1 gnl/TRDRNA2_/TRDRNA2_193035_c0~~gnl/TRDRNA2_/TRDRNA2_193035_c0_seq1.p1  ORF type:complete len:544 (-),score=92.16 gnl/TRDRNA2_/TRDRNA2_193035_c0_seq1:75-1652(-)
MGPSSWRSEEPLPDLVLRDCLADACLDGESDRLAEVLASRRAFLSDRCSARGAAEDEIRRLAAGSTAPSDGLLSCWDRLDLDEARVEYAELLGRMCKTPPFDLPTCEGRVSTTPPCELPTTQDASPSASSAEGRSRLGQGRASASKGILGLKPPPSVRRFKPRRTYAGRNTVPSASQASDAGSTPASASFAADDEQDRSAAAPRHLVAEQLRRKQQQRQREQQEDDSTWRPPRDSGKAHQQESDAGEESSSSGSDWESALPPRRHGGVGGRRYLRQSAVPKDSESEPSASSPEGTSWYSPPKAYHWHEGSGIGCYAEVPSGARENVRTSAASSEPPPSARTGAKQRRAPAPAPTGVQPPPRRTTAPMPPRTHARSQQPRPWPWPSAPPPPGPTRHGFGFGAVPPMHYPFGHVPSSSRAPGRSHRPPPAGAAAGGAPSARAQPASNSLAAAVAAAAAAGKSPSEAAVLGQIETRLQELKRLPAQEQHRGVKELMVLWHPDKNKERQEEATRIFQWLQNRKGQLLGT